MRNLVCSILLTLFTLSLLGQDINISGVVSDADGEPLIGVNIYEKGKESIGTVNDIDGTFSLRISDSAATLVFSYIGYEPREIRVAGQLDWNIVLYEQAETLGEVIVVGYGVQRKSDLTGSISSVESEDLQRIPTASFEQALQGKVAGVQVTPASGEPGRGAQIRIRGVGTLNNASPLYVVDGMLLDDISFINLQDVESVEVLKDASATAIYGSRGANGVIIITTKKGVISDKPIITLTSYLGWQEIGNKIELTNAREYATLANELAANERRPLIFDDPTIYGEGVDWQEEIFQTAPMYNTSLAIQGGNEYVRYQVSSDYFSQEGIQTGSDFQRFTLRINNEYSVRKDVTIGHNLAFIRDWRTSVPDQSGTAYRADPTIPARDENGEFNDLSTHASTGNPVAAIFYSNNQSKSYRLVGNGFLDVVLFQNFTFRSNLGLDIEQNNGKFFTPEFFVSAT
ncbi:MAG: SusC/RagA family TonB-linked outer membrane protein, partial [Saprospiraceae bacterium]|nr:SusC/RagA family TonB-linked outer membrane protein [Saprospiraceae bacterium]